MKKNGFVELAEANLNVIEQMLNSVEDKTQVNLLQTIKINCPEPLLKRSRSWISIKLLPKNKNKI